MAKPAFCDTGDGEPAYVITHILQSTTITYLCLQHYLLDKLNSVLDMPDDLLAQAGLMKIPPAPVTAEGDEDVGPVARPQDEGETTIEAAGETSPTEGQAETADPDDRRGDRGVEPGEGDRAQPQHAGTTPRRAVADRNDPDD